MDFLETSVGRLKKREKDLARYAVIIEAVNNTDVSQDAGFQKTFTYFYRVRRDTEWRKTYYSLFEERKEREKTSFEDILRALYERTGRIEASFSSKMLASIDPQKPIWDKIILKKLGLSPKTTGKEEDRLSNAVEIYKKIEGWYEDFLKGEEAKRYIEAFDNEFSQYTSFADIKKIDFILWGGGIDLPMPYTLYQIDGIIETPAAVTEEEFSHIFLEFIERNGWSFNGGINKAE